MHIKQNIDDETLISLIKENNLKAFDLLFHKYYNVLCAYCQRFVCIEDAEEIVQDVMTWLWENRVSITIEISLKSYLFKTVYNKTLNRIVKNKSIERSENLFFEKTQEKLIEDTDLYQLKDIIKHIKEAIDQLPSTYKETFIMYRFSQKSYKEIALKLGISTKTVDYRLRKATSLLREKLKYLLLLFLVLLLTL